MAAATHTVWQSLHSKSVLLLVTMFGIYALGKSSKSSQGKDIAAKGHTMQQSTLSKPSCRHPCNATTLIWTILGTRYSAVSAKEGLLASRIAYVKPCEVILQAARLDQTLHWQTSFLFMQQGRNIGALSPGPQDSIADMNAFVALVAAHLRTV